MPRSEAPQDPRHYVRIAEEIWNNPKLDEIDDPAAGWAYVVSICISAASLSDGHFSPRTVARKANVEQHIVDSLVKQELWHLPGHDCDRCPQPKRGQAYVHDYLQHQRSRAEVLDLHAKRSRAGSLGAKARWGTRATTTTAGAMADAKAGGHGTSMAEKRRGEEIPPPPPSADVDGFTGEWLNIVVSQVLAIRPDWVRADVERALANPKVRQRDPDLVERALILVAQDEATDRPSRLAASHPYWKQAARELARERAAGDRVPPHEPELDASGTCTRCPLPRRHPVHRGGR